MGRPPIPFNQEIADEICERLIESRMGLEHVLDSMRAEPEFAATPGLTTVYKWMEEVPSFAESSARARILAADTYVDAALNESHTQRLGTVETQRETKDGTFAESKIVDNVERSKLIVQTLLKRAGQLNPKKYGDKLELGGNVNVTLAERLKSAEKRLEE